MTKKKATIAWLKVVKWHICHRRPLGVNCTKADVSKEYPFCKGNCNCKACLQTQWAKEGEFLGQLSASAFRFWNNFCFLVVHLQPVVEKSKAEKTKCFKYLLAEILPVLNQIEPEQNEDLEIEHKIHGDLNSYCGNLRSLMTTVNVEGPSILWMNWWDAISCAGKEDVKVETANVSMDERIYRYCIYGSEVHPQG
jgi:hypothetical protein